MAANNKPLSRANSTAQPPNGLDAVNVQVILRCRPPSKEEVAARTPQVVRCDEAMKAVTLTQSVPGASKQQTTRTYHFDKVCRLLGRSASWAGQGRAGRASNRLACICIVWASNLKQQWKMDR